MGFTAEKIQQQLENLLRTIESDIEKYEEIAQTQIPSSLKQAVDQKWDLVFNAVEVGALLRYPQDDQDKDRQRVIKVERALKLLEQFEDDLAKETTSGLFGTLVRQLNRRIEFGSGCVAAVGVIAAALEDFAGKITWRTFFSSISVLVSLVIDLVAAFPILIAFLLVRLTFEAARTTRWALGTNKIMRKRDAVADQVRRAAFPQRDVRRYRRRKLARK